MAEALAAGRPVVALESTIITHGMPYPDNGAMAANVEKIIADEGAVPATIAVVKGRIKIGLSDGERELLAMTGDAMSCRAPISPSPSPKAAPAARRWRQP